MKRLLLLCSLLLAGFASGAQCVASFTATQTPLNNDLLRVVFANSSTFGTVASNQFTQTYFNFGDGNWGFTTNPVHTYATPGTYTIGLRIFKKDTATWSIICTDSATQVVTVSYPSCGSTMSITGSMYSATRTFTAATPAGTTGMTYSWNFGDGTTGTGSPVSHTYSSTGRYGVTLTATHTGGPTCSYTNVDSININYTSYCAYLATTLAFYPNYGGSTTVNITGSKTYYVGLITTILYNYGDGSANTSSTSHTYATGGTYSIKKIVQWKDSATNTVLCVDSLSQNMTFPSVIIGYVYYDSVAITATKAFRVWLIQFDSATNMLSAVDSLIIYGNHAPAHFVFHNVPAGKYLVKAADSVITTGITGFVPTYHDSSLYWSTAQTVTHPGYSYTLAPVWIRTGTTTGGPGFVGGNVSLGANKGSGAGVPGAVILLRNSANVAVASTRTDNAGDFSFPGIPAGSYSVYPEVMNYATTPASVSVTTGAPGVSGINFHQDDAKMNIMPHLLGAETLNKSANAVSLAPNPASQTVRLSWTSADTRGAAVVITDVTGRVVMQLSLQSPGASGTQLLDISALHAGIYFVQCTGGLATMPVKLIVQ